MLMQLAHVLRSRPKRISVVGRVGDKAAGT